MISAVILAAGLSRRMGKPKQLLPLGSKKLVEHAVANALYSKAGEVIVVIGAQREKVEQTLSLYDVKTVFNPRYNEGQGTSVAAGAAAVSSQCQGILYLLADQPFVYPEVIDGIIDAFLDKKAPVVRAGRTGHPVLFDIALKHQIMQLSGDTGGRKIISKYKQNIVTVPVCQCFLTADLDTEEDYQRAKALFIIK
ncbi:MAG: nucleotidyltransferase family protein [Firmicutes bacterium]|nr:nucleotidyltransferase family protein [Bacillota bacterium]